MKDNNVFDVVLLFALPASGKSEVRHLLANQDPEILKKEFHIGENVQLDDFPYVFLVRNIDQALVNMGVEPIFAAEPGKRFYDQRLFGALIKMLNEDYEDLFTKKQIDEGNLSDYYLRRLEKACKDVGMKEDFSHLSPETYAELCSRVAPVCEDLLKEKYANYPDTMEGKTCVIEMARGGDIEHSLPLSDPEGYQYSLRQFSDNILSRAAILYIWVTPEESRRKNHERAKPGADGSSLFHETPIEVMYHEYGICDMIYLRDHSEKPDTVTVKTENEKHYVPIGVFDNRVDKTTPFRDEPETWDQKSVEEVTASIKEATDTMWKGYLER